MNALLQPPVDLPSLHLPPAPAHPACRDSRAFADLRASLRASGGLVRAQDLALLLEDYRLEDFVGLARRIARGDLFVIDWRHEVWVPMFQYRLRDFSLRTEVASVRAELGDAFDGWATAEWFARPSEWLQGRTPLALIRSDLSELPEVLAAARADRFVAIAN